jgi:hypothetical protein
VESKGGTEPNPTGLNNGQTTVKIGEEIGPLGKPREQTDNVSGNSVISHSEYHNPSTGGGRILTDIRKIHVAGQQHRAARSRMGGDLRIRGTPQANIANMLNRMALTFQEGQRRTGHIGIQQKAHSLRRQRMERLLFSQVTDKLQGRADVRIREVILALDFLKRHAAREAAHNLGHRHARSPDHRLAVADGRVNHYAIGRFHGRTLRRNRIVSKADFNHESHRMTRNEFAAKKRRRRKS